MNRSARREVDLGYGRFNAGKFPEALACFRRAQILGDRRPQTRIFEAHCLHALGRTEAAIRRLHALCRAPGASAPAFLELARMLRQRGRHESALPIFKRAASARGAGPAVIREWADCLKTAARACGARGRHDRQARYLEQALALVPSDGQGRTELAAARLAAARRARGRGDWKGALAAARSAGALEDGEDAGRKEAGDILLALSRRAIAAGRRAQARKFLEASLSEYPAGEEARRALTAFFRQEGVREQAGGRWDRAEAALRAALALDPWRLEVRRELAAVLDGRALILEGRGRWDAARSLRRSSGELCPRPGSERTDLFRQWMRDGRFPEAFAEAEKILNEGPSLAEIRVLLIPWTREEAAQKGAAWLAALDGLKAPEPWLHLYRGTLRPGKSGLADLRRLDRWTGPRYGWMQFRAGQNFLCQGEFPEARRRLERALKFPPVDWRIRSFLAECLLCLGRPSDALAEIEQARDLAPREEVGEALAWRGAFKLWLGRYPEAREDLDWAHALGARHAAVWRAAARLKLGHKKEALALLDAAVRETPGDREAWVWRGEARRELGLRRGAREDLSREPVGAWALFNRALLCAAERNFPALRSDFDKIPEFMISHLKKKLGLPAAAPASDAARVKILEAGLSLAKGFRRDDYGYALWMH